MSKTLGAIAGALTALAFTALHQVTISDIWFNIGPMVLAGALCGLCLVWSYDSAVEPQSTRRWFAYNGSYAGLLILLGAASFVVLEPQFTMAELMEADDALQQVLPHGVPLMVAAAAIGTLGLWALYGRKPRALIPILVTQALLVFLVGHNLAILGIVEMTSGLLLVSAEFVGLTVFLAGVFAGGVVLLQILGSDRRRS